MNDIIWLKERDENGIPQRMYLANEETTQRIKDLEKEKERNRTLSYVEPSPYRWPNGEPPKEGT